MSDGITNQSGFMCATDADAAEAKRRAEWLHKHKAHKDWIILSVSEIAVIRGELLAVERELADARDKTADALQRVDLRTLDFERMKKGRDLALEAIEYIAYAGLSSRHMVDYAIEFLKRNKSSVSFPRDRYEKLCEAIAEIETLRRERNQAQKWEDSAMHYCKGMEYYRGLVEQIGQTIGEAAYLQDDGGNVDSVLCAKVPELVEELKQGLAEAREENKKLREAATRDGYYFYKDVMGNFILCKKE